MIARELTRLLLSAGFLAAILALAERMRQLGARAEATRKLVHVASGLLAAAFPWLFSTPWSVSGLAAGYAALMAWSRASGRLQSVHGVRRRTSGGLCYPAAVALVFLLAHRHPEAYLPSILVLALGDAAAALVGSAHGRTRYRTSGGTKSVEGSLAFLAVALPCIAVPLLLLTPFSPLPVLVWSALVAVLVCALEALAPGGSDNLLVPAACCLALLHVTSAPPPAPWVLWLTVAVLGTLLAAGHASPAAEPYRARPS